MFWIEFISLSPISCSPSSPWTIWSVPFSSLAQASQWGLVWEVECSVLLAGMWNKMLLRHGSTGSVWMPWSLEAVCEGTNYTWIHKLFVPLRHKLHNYWMSYFVSSSSAARPRWIFLSWSNNSYSNGECSILPRPPLPAREPLSAHTRSIW